MLTNFQAGILLMDQRVDPFHKGLSGLLELLHHHRLDGQA
jgi:hypothetical protein